MSLTGAIRRTGHKMQKAVTGKAPDQQDMDILDKLKQEHEEVKALLKKLVDSDSAPDRRKLLQQIKGALVPHVRAEEKVVYNAIIALKGKDEKQDGIEGYIEHKLADEMLEDLGKIANVTSPEFSAGAKVLKELVEHHVQEEEANVWDDVRENFTDEDRLDMNRQFEAAKKKVRVP